MFLPTDVARTLAPAVHEVMAGHHGGLLTIGVLATLWGMERETHRSDAGTGRVFLGAAVARSGRVGEADRELIAESFDLEKEYQARLARGR